MTVSKIQNLIVPQLKAHTGKPFIEADQGGDMPDGPHGVFKFIVPHGKETGRPNLTHDGAGEGLKQRMAENYRVTMSVSTIAEDNDTSVALAQAARDWFAFHGSDILAMSDIALISLGDVGNRDSVLDEESRNGFDVILRASRELERSVEYFTGADIEQEK